MLALKSLILIKTANISVGYGTKTEDFAHWCTMQYDKGHHRNNNHNICATSYLEQQNQLKAR